MNVTGVVGRKVQDQALGGSVIVINGLGHALVRINDHVLSVNRSSGPSKRAVVLLKAAGEGAIAHGGKARLGVDARGRKHWRTEEQPGDQRPGDKDGDPFTKLGITMSNETAEKSGKTYVGFSGETYAQLAKFRALKDQGLVWGFRKAGQFMWACKPENLSTVTEAFGGTATKQPTADSKSAGQPAEKSADAKPGSSEPRSDRRGDDRSRPQPERGGDGRVPEGAKVGGDGKAEDDRRSQGSSDRAERNRNDEVKRRDQGPPTTTTDLHAQAVETVIAHIRTRANTAGSISEAFKAWRKETLFGPKLVARVSGALGLGDEGVDERAKPQATEAAKPTDTEPKPQSSILPATKELAEMMAATTEYGSWSPGDGGNSVIFRANDKEAGRSEPVRKLIAHLEQQGLEVWHKVSEPGFEVVRPGTKKNVVDGRGRPVKDGPDKVKSLEEIEAEREATEKARPKEFGKYGQPGGVRHWQVSEEDFIETAHRAAKERAKSNADSWRRTAEDPKERSAQRRKAANQVEIWERLLGGYGDQPTEKQIAGHREEYAKLVKKAISTGEPVPVAVIEQRPEFRKARNDRERYEKGRHTSYANKSIAVRNDLVESHGVKIKRQDGKSITDAQTKEIADGIREIESVLGPMGDLLRKADVTIAHTNGKMPFLMKAGGVFHAGENTVTVGIAGVRAMAHELAHWLDFEAGAAKGHTTYIYRNNHSSKSTSWAAGEDGSALISAASRSMNNAYLAAQIAKVVSPNKIRNIGEDEKAEVKRIKVSLGSYWRRPEEIFARLVEQHIATERAAAGHSAPPREVDPEQQLHVRQESSHSAHEEAHSYQNMPGWWDAETFAKLQPMVREALAERIEALGGDSSHVRKGGLKAMAKAGPLRRLRWWISSLFPSPTQETPATVPAAPRLVLLVRAPAARTATEGAAQ